METKTIVEELPSQKKPSKRGGARPGTGGAMPGAGRPPFQPTELERKQVEALAGYGLPHDQICTLIRDGIHHETLMKHFRRELDTGKAKANAAIGRTLHQKAMAGDTAAAIWWSKAQMRWNEVHNIAVNVQDLRFHALRHAEVIEDLSTGDVPKLSTN